MSSTRLLCAAGVGWGLLFFWGGQNAEDPGWRTVPTSPWPSKIPTRPVAGCARDWLVVRNNARTANAMQPGENRFRSTDEPPKSGTGKVGWRTGIVNADFCWRVVA